MNLRPVVTVTLAQLALFAVLIWYGQSHDVIHINFEVVTIVLASSAVILTATAIIIALVGLAGYRELRERAEKIARDTATTVAGDVAREIADPVATRATRDYVEENLPSLARQVSENFAAELRKDIATDEEDSE